MTSAAIEAPAFLQLAQLSDDEDATRARLIGQLRRAQKVNARQEAFYEGSRRVRDLGIAIPPHLRDLEAVAAWPEIVVDVIDERMDWRGWSSSSDVLKQRLASVYWENHGDIEVSQATLDALIYGLGYLSVGTGADGEPDVLLKAESPNQMTAVWDTRLRRATSALRETFDESGRLNGWVLYSLNETVRVERQGGRLMVVDRDEHNRNRVPIAALLNRPRSSRMTGRSEITRAVRSATETGMRTLVGLEVAREFYGAPQRYLMGATEAMFVDEQGNKRSQWDAIIGHMLMAPRDENGELPTPGQFSASSPQPFTEILKVLAQGVSGATGIPLTHFGYATDNPTSADAIDRADRRMNKRASRRQVQYDLGLLEAANLVSLWADDTLPDPQAVSSLWVKPDALTPSAAADRATKMIGSGALQPDWDFTLEQYGLTDQEIARVRQERLKATGRQNLSRLAVAAGAARQDPDVADLDKQDVRPQAYAMAALIRGGVDPQAAAERVGLTGLKFAPQTED